MCATTTQKLLKQLNSIHKKKKKKQNITKMLLHCVTDINRAFQKGRFFLSDTILQIDNIYFVVFKLFVRKRAHTTCALRSFKISYDEEHFIFYRMCIQNTFV